ncbi:hypothetical protein PInf_007120 [Phytophthora infestans]|nr:hypothetical protein PInf_007120 [Phytophthora infestans]
MYCAGPRKETLVRLLLSDGLETVEAWAAALDGEDADGGIPLKRALVDDLNTVDETIEEQFKDCKVMTETADTAIPSMKTVEELLDFCFLHAEQLATCSLLCAAKLHALAVRTQRSPARLAEDDEVLVRLRWSFLLKPVLFKPLLQHAVALKTMSRKIMTWNSEELGRLVGLVDVTDRVAVLEEMRASRDELERGFRAGVEHIHSSASTSKKQSALETLVAEYLKSLSDEKRKSLMAELERDLDEAPPHLFPSVFLFFGLIFKAMTLFSVPEEQEQDQVVEAVSILCALFDRRSHDPSSYLDVLSLLNKVNLSKILPPRTMRQVSIRLGAY